ncbi:MAG: class I SAM-dependent DNA methyltransferase [Limisphaerales bacterium]
MTPAEFKTKWAKVSAKESAAYQEHFNDLCRLLGQPTPNEADPSGSDFFCFQKRVVKDVELFELHETPDAGEPTERGFADVWKKGCFAWEYKGKKKNLDEAYRQLLRYRESLLNPPLLVVCDFDRYIVKTNFNGTVQEVHEFTNDQIDRPENLRILRALFTDPEFLKPQRTTAQVTKTLAEKFAQVAVSLQKRESAEYADARTREEFRVEQKKNLRIARFLNRLVFCFFAEDTGLLPKKLFSEIAKIGLENKDRFIETLQRLFRVMAKGGNFGKDKIRYFNGHLFEDSTVFDLSDDERRLLAEASEADWQFVEPSIMGTLFARGLDPDQRAALGAQYTSREDIVTIVEPVLMAPLRREWAALKASLLPAFKHGKATPADRARIAAFLKKLRQIIVLDPACGSGNFLYVSLQLLLGLEKEVVTFAMQLGFKFTPQVSVQQLRAIEINPYAFELAQVSVQIGYLQWLRDNGFPLDRSPVLQNLDGFHNEDALLVPHFHSKAKTLKEAQKQEHEEESALKFYTEREWPKCDVIVSNPPFLGGSRLWEELGRHYQKELWKIYDGRVPGFGDLCCYWFEKARQQIEKGKCKRAGLLATQGIRGGANREVLKRIKETGDIFFAESSRDWILGGAAVDVSMIGFDDGTETEKVLDSKRVTEINANLTSSADTTEAKTLNSNLNVCFIGSKKAGEFEVADKIAVAWLNNPNPHGRPNSDVLRVWVNGDALIKTRRSWWIIDAGVKLPLDLMSGYERPFGWILEKVKPERDKNNESRTRNNFWIHKRPGSDMRDAVAPLSRCLAVVRHAKHLIFSWLNPVVLPDDGIYIFARDEDWFMGLMQSRIHRVWALNRGTYLEDRPRYTPTTCFETFPFPRPTPAQEAAIAAAAMELNELRERWLNPPEWTRTEYLEFPASVDGPWSRYVDCGGKRSATPLSPIPARQSAVAATALPAQSKIGLARYPRLVPKDAACAAKLKKRTLTNLYNERPAWLDLAHKKLDAAVAAAYGFPADLTDEQILEKLLALNLARAAEEAKAAKVKKPKTSRDKKEDEMI